MLQTTAYREWDPIDQQATREGLALLRLRRRTGAAILDRCEAYEDRLTADPRGVASLHDRRGANAFDRLFGGEKPSRELPPNRADRHRRQQQRQQRDLERCIGASLRGLPPAEARARMLALCQ